MVSMPNIRKAAVAGGFYPRFAKEITETLKENFENPQFGIGKPIEIGSKLIGDRKIIGGVCPHAGHVYSSACASHTIQALCKESFPDTVIIFGNTHTGYRDIATMQEGAWETPLGKIEIDTEITNAIIDGKNVIADDSAFMGYPHGREHNIEVQIPILQYVAQIAKKPLKIVPIVIGRMNIPDLEVTGAYLAQKLQLFHGKKDIVIIASSDMTHHEPKNYNNPKEDIAWQHKKDQAVMDAFVEMNHQKTFEKAAETTVCGPQTITLLMVTAKKMGYSKSHQLKYYTSYERMGAEGPCEYSVGYFSGIIFKD